MIFQHRSYCEREKKRTTRGNKCIRRRTQANSAIWLSVTNERKRMPIERITCEWARENEKIEKTIGTQPNERTNAAENYCELSPTETVLFYLYVCVFVCAYMIIVLCFVVRVWCCVNVCVCIMANTEQYKWVQVCEWTFWPIHDGNLHNYIQSWSDIGAERFPVRLWIYAHF